MVLKRHSLEGRGAYRDFAKLDVDASSWEFSFHSQQI
jgi:hypothetical protein